MAPTVRRVLPAPITELTIEEACARRRNAPHGRPWVSVCMIASLDGSVSLDGTSGGLGNATDRAMLASMRAIADIVLVGAGTARAEQYGPPRRGGQRIAVATNSGRVDPSAPLFTSHAGFVLAPAGVEVPAGIDVLRAGDGSLDLTDAISRLHDVVPGVTHVHAEGGPRLNGSLLDADLVDELDLTISPRLVGGDGARLTVGAERTNRRFALDQLVVDDDGFTFGRWVR